MLYDNQGNLVLTRTTTPGGNTSTIDFGVTETVLTSSTTTTARYYFVAGQRVAEQVGSTFSYLIPNLEGGPTVALSARVVSAVQLFLPYGASGFAWGRIMPTAHNYTDQLLDSVMGLLYYGARYYDPLADQFVSADSVQGNPGGMNPYGYVGGNPETYIDPTGHFEDPENPAGDGGGSAAGGGDGEGGSAAGGSGDGSSSGGDGGFDVSVDQYINYEDNSDQVTREENALDGVDANPVEQEQQLEQGIQREEQKAQQQDEQKPTDTNQRRIEQRRIPTNQQIRTSRRIPTNQLIPINHRTPISRQIRQRPRIIVVLPMGPRLPTKWGQEGGQMQIYRML